MAFRRTDPHACWPPARARLLALAALLVLLAAMLVPAQRAFAVTVLTVERLTWNVVGLDSNNELSGPNEFPVGVRVCNTGLEPATNVTARFVWDSVNANINLLDDPTLVIDSLAAGDCHEFYYTVVISRVDAVRLTSRDYHIEVTAGNAPLVTTTLGEQIYVENLVSQNRNAVQSVSVVGGLTTLYIGETYDIQLLSSSSTAYEQIESFVTLPNTIFEVQGVQRTYGTIQFGYVPETDRLYADACGWNDLTRTCTGTGKAGGDLTTIYTVQAVGAGSVTSRNLIYDFSGSSYHYNSDFNNPDAQDILNVTVVSPVSATKTDAVVIDADGSGTITAGDTLEYRVTITNTSPQTASGVSFSDSLDSNTTLVVNSVTATQGLITSGNNPGNTSVAVNVGTMAAGAQVIITYRAIIDATAAPGTTLTNQGTLYNNLIEATITDDPDAAGATDATTTMIGSPTAVELASFTANDEPAAAVLRWTTTVEQDSWGFHIYRSPDGMQKTAVQMTSAPVMARGRGSEGASYSWADSTVVPGSTYSYWLVEIDMQGNQAWYGPVSVLIHYKALLPLAKF